MKHKIKNIKFSYFDKKYGLGPYIDFIGEMEVPSLEYEDVVNTLQKAHPEYKDIYLMSFSKSTINNNMKKIIFYVAFQIIGKYLLFINCLLSIT